MHTGSQWMWPAGSFNLLCDSPPVCTTSSWWQQSLCCEMKTSVGIPVGDKRLRQLAGSDPFNQKALSGRWRLTFPHCRHFPVWRLRWTQWCRTTLDWKTTTRPQCDMILKPLFVFWSFHTESARINLWIIAVNKHNDKITWHQFKWDWPLAQLEILVP